MGVKGVHHTTGGVKKLLNRAKLPGGAIDGAKIRAMLSDSKLLAEMAKKQNTTVHELTGRLQRRIGL